MGPSLIAQLVKNPPATWEIPVLFLGQEDPLVKEMATHSSNLVWRIPWTGAWRVTVHGVTVPDTTEQLTPSLSYVASKMYKLTYL